MIHLSDCPILERPVWDDEDVLVAMDWALEHGYDADEHVEPYPGELRQAWSDYEPEHVREALEHDVDPFAWKPEVDASYEYGGMSDYYSGHGLRPGEALLYASYGFGTTLGELVEQWMSELVMGFPGEEDPRWAQLSDKQIKEALESIFVQPYNPDALWDNELEEPEEEEYEEFESPVVIVLLTVTSTELK